MTDVSGRSTKSLVEAVEKCGLSPKGMVEGLPVKVEELCDVTRNLDWDTFMALHDNLERMVKNPLEIEAIGARMVLETPLYEFFRRVAGRLITPQQLHFVAQRWLVPAIFPMLKIEFVERADGRVLIINEIPEPLRSSRSFFYIARGAIANVSTLLGLAPTVVDMELSGGRAEFLLTLPPALSMPQRAVRVLRSAFGANALVDELLRQQQELRQSYQLLLRARQDFRQVLERVPTGVAIHGDGKLLWANPALVRLLGYDRPRQIIGQPLLSFVHPEDHGIARRHTEASLDQPSEPEEYRLVRKDGEILTCELAPAREVSFEGRTARLLVLLDVSERQRMQRQLLLADRMASLGTLAAGIAHEINNPLAYVHGSLEIAEASLAKFTPASLNRTRQALAIAREGIDRVRTIAADLKAFSRAPGPAIEPVDVHAVLDSTLTLAMNQIRQRARLVKDYGDVPLARANSARLGQVFLNLLLNAVEAIPEGQHAAQLIRVRTRIRSDRITVEIADSGVGSPPQVLPRIFDPFFTTKPIGSGTGLGLAICHRIVTDLGGSIEVESPSRETTLRTAFRVSLPAALNVEGESRRQLPAQPRRGVRGRVLIVDDEPALLDVLRGVVAPLHEVVLASSGRAALDLLRENATYDVVLCDLMMAGVDGVGVFDELCLMNRELADRVVFMTGGAFTPRVREFLARVPNPCLEKPFDASRVLDLIDERMPLKLYHADRRDN
jgi:PAS domain S-box-containing protein